VVNLARIDWQVNSKQYERVPLVDILWHDIEKEFKESGIRARHQIIQLVQKVAYFQPDKALVIAEWAIKNPTNKVEKLDDIFAKVYPPTYQDVLHEIPAILKRVAYNMDYLIEAVNLLWELAKNDSRRPSQYPDHPIRVLQDLASYQIGKPVGFNDLIIDACEQWLKNDHISGHLYSPFDVLDGLLATEGSDDASEGFVITFRPYSINLSAVQKLRDRVNELAFQQIKSINITDATRAIKSIGVGLHYPHGLFGRTVEEREMAIWTPIFVATIDKLTTIVTDERLDPVIDVTIRGILNWHVHYSKTDTNRAARKLFESLSRTLEHETALALHDGWGELFDHVSDHLQAEQKKQEWLNNVATKVIAHNTDKEVAEILEKRLDQQQQIYEDNGHPGQFVWTLIKARSTIGIEICRRILVDSKNPLNLILPTTLSQLADAEPRGAIEISWDLLKTDNITLIRSVAQAFGWNRGGRLELIEGELELLNILAINKDEYVRTAIIRTVKILAKKDKNVAINLLSRIQFGNSFIVAKEYFSLFGKHGDIDLTDLPKQLSKTIWLQLLVCPSIDDYHITEFLAEVSASNPDIVLKLLKGRVEADEKSHDSDKFHALPHHWRHILQTGNQTHKQQMLREVRNWIAEKPDSWQRIKMGAEIFMALAGAFDQVVIDVLYEAIRSGSKDQMRAVAAILREAPRSFVWEHVDFVKQILRAAANYDEKILQHVSSNLYASVISGVRSGTPGQPFNEDLEQRDKSLEIYRSLTPGTVEAKFYQSLERSARQSIKSHAERDEKLLDGRDW
jgi:hypothetical protein